MHLRAIHPRELPRLRLRAYLFLGSLCVVGLTGPILLPLLILGLLPPGYERVISYGYIGAVLAWGIALLLV